MDPTSWRLRLATAGLGLLLSAQGQAIAASPASGNSDDEAVIAAHEADRPGRIDYGYGIGVRPPAQSAATALVAAPAAVPPGAEAHVTGFFGSPAGYGAFPWPIVALHVALLPDGRVFNFGSTEDGKQGGFVYDVWDPAAGTGPGSHTTMPTIPTGGGCERTYSAPASR